MKNYVYPITLFLIIFGFLALIPSVIGQGSPPTQPHRVWGLATINENPVARGTTVSAMADGEEIASDTTDSDGFYTLNIPSDVNDATFYVRNIDTGKTLNISSGTITELNLNITDNTSPTIEVETPSDGRRTDESNVMVRGSVSDDLSVPEELSVAISGESVQLSENGTFSRELDLVEGINSIEVYAEDLIGNSTSKSIEVTLDNHPPSLELNYPEIVQKKNAVIDGQISDAVSSVENIVVFLNDDQVSLDENGRFEIKISLTQGANNITLVAEDEIGNSVSKSVRIISDTVPPRVSIDSPASGKIIGSDTDTVTIEGYVSDDVDDYSQLTVTLNDDPLVLSSGGSFSKEIALESGENPIEVVVVDRAGNKGSDEIKITKDIEKPEIILENPEKEKITTTNDTITVSGTVQDDVSEGRNISVSVGGVIVSVQQDGSFEKTISLEMGSNLISINARDSVGNTSVSSITVDRISETNWTLLAAMVALVAVILAILAIWKREQVESEGRGL